MILQLVKKELLLYWRRPRELVVLLLMPFVLITILGAALGSINDNGTPEINMKLAIIQKDDIEAGREKIIQQLESHSVSEVEKASIITAIKSFHPIEVLQNEVFDSDELKSLIEVVYVENELTDKEAKKYSAVLEIPSQFTENFYANVFFEGSEIPELALRLNESSSLEGSIIKDIFSSFTEELSFMMATQTLGISSAELKAKLANELGKTKMVSEKRSVDSVSYYAIGMSVMFMFYAAGNAATMAFEEKQNQIFGRVLLASLPIPVFFLGIFAASALISFLQMNILFGLSALVHGVTWPNVIHYLVVTFLLSVMIGAFSIFIAAISYRIHSDGVNRVFSNFIIPIIALIGGSFVPVSQLGGAVFEEFSKYTPGGAGISAYYKIMQGYSLGDISTQILSIVGTILVLTVAAFFIQPKRGETA